MAAADQVIMLSLGRSPDPLLDEVIGGEGYEVVRASEPAEVLSSENASGCAAVAVLVGDGSGDKAHAFLTDAPARFPHAKFIIAAADGRGIVDMKSLPSLADRVLWVGGETCNMDSVKRIRRFLRGEGYAWARDLESDSSETALLGAAAREKLREPENARSILRFAGDLSHFTELRPMLDEALNRYLQILKCDAGSIYLWDENDQSLVLEAAAGPDQTTRIGLRQKLGEGLAGWVAKVGEPMLVTDSRKVHKLSGRTCRRYSNFSVIALPVMHGGQLFGVVCLTEPRENERFDPDDLQLARNLSQKLATAIRPLTVLSELRRFSERLLGAFRSSSDMVIKKDAEVEALRDLNRNILDNVPLAVIAYDADLRVLSANETARAQFGTQPGPGHEPAAAPLERGIEMDPVLWRRKLRDVLTTGRKFRLQRLEYRSGERLRMLDIHCSPLGTHEGQPPCGVLTVQDVTEDVDLERKLQSAERLALVGKIAAKVAHELNNPLDGILRFISLAVREIENPEKSCEYLEESRRGLLRMSHILAELLAFSRSYYATHRPVSLTQLIHQGLAPYERRAREANIHIAVNVPPDLPTCPSNEVWGVFGNVVKNALDAIGENGKLVIKARTEEDKVLITVADSGPGVPNDLRQKIFEPFFTTKKEGTGTGLGLAVCQDALRRIGGEIGLLPSDSGATFQIEIPVEPTTATE